DLVEDVVSQVVPLIKIEVALQATIRTHLRNPAAQATRICEQINRLFFPVGKCPIPEDMGHFGREQTAFKEAFGLVIKTDSAVLYRQSRCTGQRRTAQDFWQAASDCAVPIGLVREISGKKLVGAFPAQSDRGMSSRELRKEP